MKPTFMAVQSHYQSRKTVIREQLFAEIGWEDLIPKPEYNNTCAIRVSLALIKCGFTLNGRIAIKKGKYKGKLIEPGQAKLARMLAERQYLGPPEIFPRDDALRSRKPARRYSVLEYSGLHERSGRPHRYRYRRLSGMWLNLFLGCQDNMVLAPGLRSANKNATLPGGVFRCSHRRLTGNSSPAGSAPPPASPSESPARSVTSRGSRCRTAGAAARCTGRPRRTPGAAGARWAVG